LDKAQTALVALIPLALVVVAAAQAARFEVVQLLVTAARMVVPVVCLEQGQAFKTAQAAAALSELFGQVLRLLRGRFPQQIQVICNGTIYPTQKWSTI
jgi:hypothetical protein